MKRLLVLIAAVGMVLAALLPTPVAEASGTEVWWGGTFATTVGGSPTSTLSGVGLNGDFRGWQLTMTYKLECEDQYCAVRPLVWHLVPAAGGPTSLSGTCLRNKEDPTVCEYSDYTLITGQFKVQLVVSGGTGDFAGVRGGGDVSGEWVDTYGLTNTYVCCPETGDLSLALGLHCSNGANPDLSPPTVEPSHALCKRS